MDPINKKYYQITYYKEIFKLKAEEDIILLS